MVDCRHAAPHCARCYRQNGLHDYLLLHSNIKGEIGMKNIMMKKKWAKGARAFWRSEAGIGTLEIVLILAVLIILALVFKKWLILLANKLMGKVDVEADKIFS